MLLKLFLPFRGRLGDCYNNYLKWHGFLLVTMTLNAVLLFLITCWFCHEPSNAEKRTTSSEKCTCSNRIPAKLRSGIIDRSKHWPNETILYTIDPNLPMDFVRMFYEAQDHIKGRTCIRFKEWTNESEVPDYIYVMQSPEHGRCDADVGRNGSHSNFLLAESCSTRFIIHELVHTIGFFHEHERTDRDHFVNINYQNMESPEDYEQFELLNDSYVSPYGVPYDYHSIMHYARSVFSVSLQKDTITPMDPDVHIGRRGRLSKFDIKKINNMYCSGTMGIRVQNVANEEFLRVTRDTGTFRPVVTLHWTNKQDQKWTVQWYSMHDPTKCSSMVTWSQHRPFVAVMTVNETTDIVGVTADVNSPFQKWRVERVNSTKVSMWRIINCSTNKCILANGNSDVMQAPCNSSDTQQLWKVHSNDD